MRDVLNKAIPGLLTATILAVAGTWFANDRQTEENKASIIKLAQDVEKIEKTHIRRLEVLERSKEAMPDYYVTRREFNVIVQALDEKMDKVDRNVEKLLDMQIKNKE